jgi:hypothetical protein
MFGTHDNPFPSYQTALKYARSLLPPWTFSYGMWNLDTEELEHFSGKPLIPRIKNRSLYVYAYDGILMKVSGECSKPILKLSLKHYESTVFRK